MNKCKSRWRDRDLRELREKNILCEIVEYYGAYLWYSNKIDEGAFDAFYYKNKEIMKNIFINRANADVKINFGHRYMSGRKMRRLLMTGANERVISYDWIVEYTEYILEKCLSIDMLRNKVCRIIQSNCDLCEETKEKVIILLQCTNRIWGFQYTLFIRIRDEGGKKGELASHIIDNMKNSKILKQMILACGIIQSKRGIYAII